MSYLGRGVDKISNIEVLDNITFDGSSSYSITKSSVAFTPNSAQSLLISIDGVVQATNFSVSSSTIDFGVAVPSTSTCDFFLHYGTGVLFTPADGTVTEAKIGSGAVTSAKLNNDIISGTTALTSEPADTDEFLVSDAGTLKRIDYSLIKGGGITVAQQWRITASFSFSSVQDIDTNWEISDSTGYSSLGSSLTQSSGKFSFPSTGIYLILATYQFRRDTADRSVGGNITVTTNNSTYSIVSSSETNNSDIGGTENTTYIANAQTIIDCTDTANVKFALTVQAGTTQTCDGNTGRNYTGFTCIRLGDT